MTTKTPITDAAIFNVSNNGYDHTDGTTEGVPPAVSRDLETKLTELAATAQHYLDNSIPSAEHMAEWHKLKDALAAMPNVESSRSHRSETLK